MKQTITGAAIWGAVTGGAVAAWTLVEYGTGIHATTSSVVRLLSAAVALPIVALGVHVGMRARRAREAGGEIGLVRLLGSGLLIALCAGVAVAAWTAVYDTAVNPGYLDGIAEEMKRQLEQEGVPAREAEDQVRAQLGLAQHVVMGFVGTALVGVLAAVASSVMLRRREGGDRRMR